LEYVSAANRLLYFADGGKIPLKFGPGRYGEIPKQDMKAIMAISGEGSIVARAFAEIGSIAMPNRTRFDRILLILTSVVLFWSPIAIAISLNLNGTSIMIAMGLGGSLFVCPLIPFVIKNEIKRSRSEKKFGPPRGYPNVLWHRQF